MIERGDLMKIDIKNQEILKDGRKKRLSKKHVAIGIITAFVVVGLPAFLGHKNREENTDFNNVPKTDYSQLVLADPVEASVDEVNSMNIIINDDDTGDNYIDQVYNELEKQGVKFILTKNSNNINVDESVVITLDQQYIAGPGIILLAPYDNTRLGNSDALVLSTNAAFNENGLLIDGIEAGKRGFRQDSSGSVMERIPTKTEEIINDYNNTSFVTICFGTDNINPARIASCLKNALTRYYYYINNDDIKEDLIYRTEKNDTLEDLANRFNTTSNYLKAFNNIASDILLTDSTIKNPAITNIREFDSNVSVQTFNVNNNVSSK